MTNAMVVPAVDAASSVTAIRSLGRRGVRTIAVADTERVPSFRSAYCDERHLAPPPGEDLSGYADALLALARRQDVVSILPVREADIYVLAKHREAFSEHVATPWMPFEAVRGVQDWLSLLESAEAAGVPTPETRPLDEWDDWSRPAVIKSRYSIVEEGNRAVAPGMEFVEAGEEPDAEAIVAEMGHVPIVQEYVPGTEEHGYFALLDDGEPVAAFQHRRIRSYTYSGGASVYRKAVDIPSLAKEGEAILTSLDWHGPAMAEFKRDPRDGEFKLIEINPRFWGSLALPVRAGVDFPALYYDLAAGQSVGPAFDYEVGVGSHLLRGEASYLHSLLRYDYDVVEKPALSRAVPTMLASLLAQPNFDFLDVDDPGPFLATVLDVMEAELVSPLRARLARAAGSGRVRSG